MAVEIVYCFSRRATDVSYHDAIVRIAAQDWSEVSTKLQLHDIPNADMPRLLFECILELQEWQGKTQGLIGEIESLQTRTEQYRQPAQENNPTS